MPTGVFERRGSHRGKLYAKIPKLLALRTDGMTIKAIAFRFDVSAKYLGHYLKLHGITKGKR